MRPRLPNCERWHPDTPSEWSTYVRRKGDVIVGVRRICLECNRARCRAQHHDLAAPAPIEETPVITPYNILPRLNWTPPSI